MTIEDAANGAALVASLHRLVVVTEIEIRLLRGRERIERDNCMMVWE